MALTRKARASNSALAPVPTHVVTGFLGAGKTTLINRWLADPRGERIAVIVNEFGDLGIDGDLIVASDEEVIELANGCVCCTVRQDLVEALHGLLDRRRRRLMPLRFDRMVIETSGLASPGPILQTMALEARLADELTNAGVVTVAHARHILQQVVEHPEAEEQLGYADCVVVNHSDEVSPQELETLLGQLSEGAGLAQVHVGRHGQTDVDLRRVELSAASLKDSSAMTGGASGHGHTLGADSIALESDSPLNLHRLKMWLQLIERDPSTSIWRIKGRLACREVPEEVIVQGVYQTLEIGPGDRTPPERSRLVIIGRDLEEDALIRGWDHCRASATSQGELG